MAVHKADWSRVRSRELRVESLRLLKKPEVEKVLYKMRAQDCPAVWSLCTTALLVLEMMPSLDCLC